MHEVEAGRARQLPVQAPDPAHEAQASAAAQRVDMEVGRRVALKVDLTGRHVQLVPAGGQLGQEAEGDEPVAVRPVIGEHGRGSDGEDPERHRPSTRSYTATMSRAWTSSRKRTVASRARSPIT